MKTFPLETAPTTCLYFWTPKWFHVKTRLHSRMMPTACLLPVSPRMHCGGGGCLLQEGVPAPGGCLFRGGGGCSQGGVCSWGCLLGWGACIWSWGVPAWGVSAPWGSLPLVLGVGVCSWRDAWYGGCLLLVGACSGGVPASGPGGCNPACNGADPPVNRINTSLVFKWQITNKIAFSTNQDLGTNSVKKRVIYQIYTFL